MIRTLIALCFVLIAGSAQAATCYWVGGSGTVSTTNSAQWASATGGTGGTCAATGGVPKQSVDVLHFDGHALGLNGGTATFDSSFNGLTVATINMTLMVGTVNFNGQNLTIGNQITLTGTSTRSVTCGSSTFTFTQSGANVWDATNSSGATISCASSTFVLAAPAVAGGLQTISGGTSQSYGSLVQNSRTNGVIGSVNATTGIQFANITINGGRFFLPSSASIPVTVTNALTLTGTSSGLAGFEGGSTNAAVPSSLVLTGASVTASWAAVRNVTVSGGSISGTAIFDMGSNTNVTASAPPAGSGGKIIGGGI